MPADDIVTRGDLKEHCDAHHGPIAENFKDMKDWLSKLDARLWALVIGMLMMIVTATVNMVFTMQTKSAVIDNRPQSYYDNQLNKRRDKYQAEYQVRRIPRDTTFNHGQ